MRFYRTVQDLQRQISEHRLPSYEDVSASQFFRLIKDSFPCHFGQKKLFYALLEFLTICNKKFDLKDCLLVYIGAAPCNNLRVILPLFPDLMIDLYDPAKFSIRESDRVSIFTGRRGYVTDSTLPFIYQRKVTLQKRHILLVSDIRRSTNEKDVLSDMRSQERWAHQLQAAAVSFKFRAPYEAKTFRYIKGQLFIQIRAPVRSAELRLIAFINSKTRDYDSAEYDVEKLDALVNFHNINVRTRPWKSKIALDVNNLNIGLANDYEGVAEYEMIKNYLSCSGIKPTNVKVLASMREINAMLIKSTGVDTTLSCRERTMKKWLEKHKKDLRDAN